MQASSQRQYAVSQDQRQNREILIWYQNNTQLDRLYCKSLVFSHFKERGLQLLLTYLSYYLIN